MARCSGMTLEHRYGSFDRSAFTAASTTHASIWRKDPS